MSSGSPVVVAITSSPMVDIQNPKLVSPSYTSLSAFLRNSRFYKFLYILFCPF